MHGQHNVGGLLTVHAEKRLQHFNHKFHGGVVVVDEYDFEQGRPCQFRLALLQRKVACAFLLLVTHTDRDIVTDVFHVKRSLCSTQFNYWIWIQYAAFQGVAIWS